MMYRCLKDYIYILHSRRLRELRNGIKSTLGIFVERS